jgi:tetratricopeptide (TPR) repeat protein
VIGALVLLWRLAAGLDEAAGREALRAGRYEEASRRLETAMAVAPSYDGLVALGLARGRLGRSEEAAAAFERALALDPARPEAWLERGGLRFLRKDYTAAVADLRRALALREDPYARDLLAASLHLAGRWEEALAAWNELGQPKLRRLEIQGLAHTRDRVARRELTLQEGSLLGVESLRESRLRLREVGVFERVTLRPTPLGDGQADLDVIVTEQHGFARSWQDFALTSAAYAARRKVHLRYANLAGTGLSLGGDYRWQQHRPELSFAMDWPRPAGLPAVLHVRALDGRQDYDLDGERFGIDYRGVDIGLRRVLGSRTVGELSFRTRDRSAPSPQDDAPSGRILGLEASVEHRWLDTHRHRLDASLRAFGASSELGSDVGFARGLLGLSYRAFLSPPEGVFFEPSTLAARVLWGQGSDATPLDAMFAPGGSPEMELPLRGRYQVRDGTLGDSPLGRTLLLANVEWRRRLVAGTFAQWGAVLFYDAGHIARTAQGPASTFHDVGIGLRVALAGTTWLRADVGYGLTDGSSAIFVNFGQVF